MITNAKELEVAMENLRSVQSALEALRTEMEKTNPKMFAVVSQTYIRRCHELGYEIFNYLFKGERQRDED